MTKPLGFIERHGLWTDDQKRQAEELKRRVENENLQLIRVAWADPHGASRAKAVTIPAFIAALETGYNINPATSTLDSANARTFASFTRGGGLGLDEMTGSPNLTIVPDPSTFRVLPWAPGIGWVLETNISTAACPFISRPGSCCAGSSSGWPTGHGCSSASEIEWYLLRIADERLTPSNIGVPGMRGRPIRHPGRAGLLLSLRVQHGSDAAGALGARPTRSRSSACR